MYRIEKRNKELAKKIIKDHSDMAFAGVLAGNNPGEVWTHSIENPSSVLIWSEGLKCFHFMGDAHNAEFNNQLSTFIRTKINEFLKSKGMNCFEYSADEEPWYSIIRDALDDIEIKESWQRVYRLQKGQNNIEIDYIQEPYRPVVINNDFISYISRNNDIVNSDFLVDYIDKFWGCIGNFLSTGYGFAALSDNEIVSFALSSFSYDKTQAIGVETLADHRKKGLSSFLVKMLLEEFEKEGVNVWWDCMDTNIASQKTAEKAGLKLDNKYKVCWFNF